MIAVFLFDVSGIAAKPWLDAGYECWIVDIQHPTAYDTGGITREDNLVKAHVDLSRSWLPPFDRDEIAFVGAFPPCDHLAVSGARWFKGKGLRKLSESISLFATAAEFCEWSRVPYFIENPVSTIASHWRKADHWMHPWQYADIEPADGYTKKTGIWCGNGFVMPKGLDKPIEAPDNRIHQASPGPGRSNFRSATPEGFAKAVFMANGKNLNAVKAR